MRHLSQGFAIGALRRGEPIEQFLGPVTRGEEQGIQWVAIEPVGETFQIRLYAVREVTGVGDLYEFPPLDPDAEEDGIVLAETADEVEALLLAERLAGAARTRWVNFGVAAEDYRDLRPSA